MAANKEKRRRFEDYGKRPFPRGFRRLFPRGFYPGHSGAKHGGPDELPRFPKQARGHALTASASRSMARSRSSSGTVREIRTNLSPASP